jgi:ribosomal-protein-alanine N-acetyltransferase
MDPILVTERLHLRKLTHEDSGFILHLLNTKGWLEHIGDRGVRDIEDAEDYLDSGPLSSYGKNGFGLYLVQLKPLSSEKIGLCGFLQREELNAPDIGFAFLPEYEGKGFAFESSKALIENAQRQKLFSKLYAVVSKENFKSQKLLLKLGMGLQGDFYLQGKDEVLDLYAMEF